MFGHSSHSIFVPSLPKLGSIPAIAAAILCLVLIGVVGYFFYWGLKSILHLKTVQATIFIVLLLALHVIIARYIPSLITFFFFPMAIAFCSSVVLLIFYAKLPRAS